MRWTVRSDMCVLMPLHMAIIRRRDVVSFDAQGRGQLFTETPPQQEHDINNNTMCFRMCWWLVGAFKFALGAVLFESALGAWLFGYLLHKLRPDTVLSNP